MNDNINDDTNDTKEQLMPLLFSSDNLKYDIFKEKIHSTGISPIDIMLIGPTGAGKSSTINQFLGCCKAKIGYTPDPETDIIDVYQSCEEIRLWDTPGIGDSTRNDIIYKEDIINIIKKKIIPSAKLKSGVASKLIDLILIVINGNSRDLSVLFNIIPDIIKYINIEQVVIGINYCDLEMSGRNWDSEKNKPNEKLQNFILEKEKNIRKRIKDNCKVNFKLKQIVSYSALFGYNIQKLLNVLGKCLPITPVRLNYDNYNHFSFFLNNHDNFFISNLNDHTRPQTYVKKIFKDNEIYLSTEEILNELNNSTIGNKQEIIKLVKKLQKQLIIKL